MKSKRPMDTHMELTDDNFNVIVVANTTGNIQLNITQLRGIIRHWEKMPVVIKGQKEEQRELAEILKRIEAEKEME